MNAILAAAAMVLLAGVILGNAFASRMRARSSKVSVADALRRAREAAPIGNGGSQGPAGVWAELGEALAGAEEGSEPGVWGELADLIDPARFRPKLRDDVEVREFHLKWGNDYVMVGNPRDLVHYQFEPDVIDILKLMDGTRTVKEIVLDRFQDSGDLELARVAELVRVLEIGNFLESDFVDSEEAVKNALDPVSAGRAKVRGFVRTLSVEWGNADAFVRWFYDHGLKYAFNVPAQFLMGALSIAGFVAFIDVVSTHRFALSGSSLAIGFVILTVLDYLATFVHEMGHALALIHFGRRVKSAGFMIYFGSPAFFVEASDGLMLDRGQRIVQAFAGPYAETIVAGIASIIAWRLPGWPLSQTLYQFAVLGYLVIFMNLVPLLELDGYYILSDVIQVPELRPKSLAFVQHDLWHKLRNKERLTKQEVGLTLYAIVGVAFTIFCFYLSFFFWKSIFASLLGRMWRGGPIGRGFLALLAILVAGPVVRGAINLARAGSKRLRALWARVRFRLETKWRVEAAELIDALPLFDDVPEDVLSDLAGRVKLRTFAPGQPIVRQGERADAFFVVRSGIAQVIEEDPDTGNERVLQTLGRGQSFGEMGLVDSAPRTATVRAQDEVRAFEVDKGTFERLLADMINVPQFAPTLQAVAELRELPAFSHLEPDQLVELLEHGEWVNVSPGEAVIEQGEVGDAFYAIRSGRFDVIRDGELVGTVGPGSYVGEVALLLDVPRTATVVARTPVRAYRLDRDGFDELVGDAFRKGTLNPHVSMDRRWQH